MPTSETQRECWNADLGQRIRPKAPTVVLFILASGLALELLGQEPGKKKDPRPLERPRPISSLTLTDSRAAMTKVSELVKAEGFRLDGVDRNSGQLEASREDGPDKTDRIVVWLERDFKESQGKFLVYLVYGRFEQFYGETAAARVVADEAFENSRIRSLKEKLISLGLEEGNP